MHACTVLREGELFLRLPPSQVQGGLQVPASRFPALRLCRHDSAENANR